MKIAVKEIGKELQLIDTDEKYRTACCKAFTGTEDLVNFICLNKEGTLFLAANEMGLCRDLPTNFLIEMANKDYPIQKMVGTIVFVRIKPINPFGGEIWDYEVDDLKQSDIDLINFILDINYQMALTRRFEEYGRGIMYIRPLFEQ